MSMEPTSRTLSGRHSRVDGGSSQRWLANNRPYEIVYPRIRQRMRDYKLSGKTSNSNGIVEFWSYPKGFGFIITDDGQRVFAHISGVSDSIESLQAGESVWFDIEEGDRGVMAVNIGHTPLYIPSIETPFEITRFKSPSLIVAVSDCTRELVEHLKSNPNDLYQIHPRTFEEMVAAIFRNEGFETELVGSWNQADGGVDVIAIKKVVDGIDLRTAIQCKRYKPTRRITADPIRSLAGVLDRYRAHVGVVATTSYFTEPAQEETESHLWRIGLRDYNSIVSSLRELDLETFSNPDKATSNGNTIITNDSPL